MNGILVVDDEAVLIEMLSMVLGRKGYEIFSAKNGLQAQGIIRNKPLELVISDLAMPEMDGLQLLEWIRDHRSLDHMKFIMMTGKENVMEPLRRYKAVADEYIAKPFEEKELLEKVAGLIGYPSPKD
jgi:DNA-binding response OmpR family regulator